MSSTGLGPAMEIQVSDPGIPIQTVSIRDYDYKIFKDPVHGHIKLHPLCVKIVDTPQFQRLRNIKKLGGIYFVYPGASHNQFEHALGTCHLAGEMIRSLRSNQPDIGITDEDILCVEVAGLCRNLGSGPFSKVYYDFFLPTATEGAHPNMSEVSAKMLRYLLSENQISLSDYNLQTELDRTFIEEIIAGPTSTKRYEGRSEAKRFLYQIVAPGDSSRIEMWDVALWDSLARDSHHVGIRSTFDHWRLMKFSRVILDTADNLTKICYREKEVENLYDMLHAHETLMRKAVLHKTVISIETMITEALVHANKSEDTACKINTTNHSDFKLSECVDDMEAFTQLDDCIFHKILYCSSKDENLLQAKEILQMIQRRKLYKYIGSTKPIKDRETGKVKPIMEEDLIRINDKIVEQYPNLKGVFFLKLSNIDYGKKEHDPMKDVRFYKKMEPNRPIEISRDDVSHMLPEYFRDQIITLYSRNKDEKVNAIGKKEFRGACCDTKRGLQEPKFCDTPHQATDPINY